MRLVVEDLIEVGLELVRSAGYTATGINQILEVAKIPIEAGEITNLPNTTIPIDADAGQKLLKLIDTLEDNDDVQTVSHNAEIPESVTV